MPAPTDPLFAQQWHFARISGRGGNDTSLMQRVWDDYTGAGVHVGVYDSGVERTHFDLNNNYDATRHVVVNGSTLDGNVVGDDGHGTSVAGIIAAENNGQDTVGIAFGAGLTGVNIFDSASAAFINAANPVGFLSALHQMTNFDVTNHSWGSFPDYLTDNNLNVASSFAARVNAEYRFVTENGRGGLGTVVVQAAGNDNLNAQGEGLNASRHTVTVGALLENGFASSYSSFGSCLLVSASGGDRFVDFAANDLDTVNGTRLITATDQLGANGFNDIQPDVNLGNPATYKFIDASFTDNMNGTSAATPMVTGVVALMLDANAGLGWRDVNDILAMSARHTGSAIGGPSGLNEDNTWFVNGAGGWNGGGMHYSEDYGYGALDAYGAVRIAEAYAVAGAAARTSANEAASSTGTVTFNQSIPDLGTRTVNLTMGGALEIGQVQVTARITHSYWGDLELFLVSPEGTEVQLSNENGSFATASDAGLTWTFGVEALRGELAAGTWQLRAQDVAQFDSGTLNTVKIDVFGHAASASDHYVYTDDFALMRDLDAARGTLADTDGGIDWIDAAALPGNTAIDLRAGQTSSIDGRTLVIAAGSVIENAISGDGADTLTGNPAANSLFGMRGNDLLRGNEGDDILGGGCGGDALQGGTGTDTADYRNDAGAAVDLASLVFGGSAAGDTFSSIEIVSGSDTAADTLSGNGALNRFEGNGGNDVLSGAAGNDRLWGGTGTDRLEGDAGTDQLTGGLGADRFQFADALQGSDRVADFDTSDLIEIAAAGFGAGLAPGALAANRFVAGTHATEAFGQFHYFVNGNGDGTLRWDADGTGAGIAATIAVLTGASALGAADFILV